MDFDLSDEQRMLQDSVTRLLAKRCTFEQRKKNLAQAPGYSAALWSQFAEMGLLGLAFSEEDGGFGGGPVDTLIVMQAMGRALAPAPYLPSAVVGAGIEAPLAFLQDGHSMPRSKRALRRTQRYVTPRRKNFTLSRQ